MDMASKTASIINSAGRGAYVFVCEHASPHIPAEFRGLGLDEVAKTSHVAFDPGALGVAELLSATLNSPLVTQNVSRLVYDCNRPPNAQSAMPERSEIYTIPGNTGLSAEQREDRVRRFYEPFRTTLRTALNSSNAILVTIHSFTPIFHGRERAVQIGVLHDEDTRLANALLQVMETDKKRYDIRRNEPYGAKDGVTHTLKEHALPNGLVNVMLEVRNDLIRTPEKQQEMAAWIGERLEQARQVLNQSTEDSADA